MCFHSISFPNESEVTIQTESIPRQRPLVSIQLVSPTSGETRATTLRTWVQSQDTARQCFHSISFPSERVAVELVEQSVVKLVSPTSGEDTHRALVIFRSQLVSIQLVSPTSGEPLLSKGMESIYDWCLKFPFNQFPQRVGSTRRGIFKSRRSH